MDKRKGTKAFLIICAALIVGVPALFAAAATAFDYRPAAIEPLAPGSGSDALKAGESLRIVSWNTGYGGLDAGADFFMDGGSSVNPESQDTVRANVKGMARALFEWNADIVLLQEVDRNSSRTAYADQTAEYAAALEREGAFAYNFKSLWVPYPLPMIGHVESGIYTSSRYAESEAYRIALPSPYTWPVSTCNLKRCLLAARFPIEGADKELVVINLHLEAYDSGEGRAAQMKMLGEVLEHEYKKGNYVIAGGDFNQTFPGGLAAFPLTDEAGWQPGELTYEALPAGFSFAADASAPSCRSLISAYSGAPEHQCYLIDGFIVSDNVAVASVETRQLHFQLSDHDPVLLEATLK